MFDGELKTEIRHLARHHEIDPAVLLAVVEVESGGRLGAKINNRMEPLIRFEGHYFYRLLPNAKRNEAIVAGLASARAGVVRNPMRQAGRWKLLKRAEAIDRPAALSSCSWGCGQVMGAHWRWIGYASIDALVAEARAGADGQIRLMMRFIRKSGLVEKLQNHDWAGFARAYNGPSYARYGYDKKLQMAYQKRVKGRELPDKRLDLPRRNGMFGLKYGSQGMSVRVLQENLVALGYWLTVDGDFGPATERMVKVFQRENRLKVDGTVGLKTMDALQRLLGVAA